MNVFCFLAYFFKYILKISTMPKRNNSDSDNLNPLNTLAAGLVHEIKNPLNTLSVNLQLLEEDLQRHNLENDLRIPRKIQLLQKEVSRLENILSDFLRFAKKQKLHLEKCNINEIIDSVLDFLAPEVIQKSIRILKSFDAKLPNCYLDRNVIKQALLNIILNAQQAMPKGGKATVQTNKNGIYVLIEITESGIATEHEKL